MNKITVYHDNIGSNPGGKCRLQMNGCSVDSYIKYCTSSGLPKHHAFKPQRQPIYEGLTLVLAQTMGLEVPDYFILIKEDNQDIPFEYEAESTKKLDSGRPFYFVSRLVKIPEKENLTLLHDMMKPQKLYRDLLLLGDVSGKKQNYALIDRKYTQKFSFQSLEGSEDSGKKVLYIDLGCSFVDAVGGKLSQRNSITKLKNNENNLKKSVKRAMNYLNDTVITSIHSDLYEQTEINLGELISSIPSLKLNSCFKGERRLETLLNEEEIHEIQTLLTLNMFNVMKKKR